MNWYGFESFICDITSCKYATFVTMDATNLHLKVGACSGAAGQETLWSECEVTHLSLS